MGGAYGTNGGEKERVRLLIGEPEGKKPLERLKRRWIDNIKMYLFDIVLGGVDWIGLAQNR
jgi:hypothetical protein